MAVDIGPRIGLQGEDAFRKQLLNVNQSLKTLDAEMKLVTAQFDKNADSEKALTEKNEILAKKVSALNDKLEKQEKALAESAKMYGETDTKTLKWQQAVLETKEALAKAEAEIKENTDAIDRLGDETSETGDQFDKANADIKENNELLSEKRVDVLKGIATGFEAIAAAAAAAAGALAKMTADSGEWADDLNTLAKQTGISTEDLQKYQYAADRIDVSVDTLTGSMSKLTRNMNSAKKGTGAASDAFKKLGIKVTDSEGKLRDNEDVFVEAINALGRIRNETERDAIAMEIFGKSAQDLNPLILGGADALEQLGQEAEDAGIILSQESIDKLNGVADAMDTLKASFEGAGHLFSVEFAEPIAAAVDLVTGYIQQITSAFDGTFESISTTLGAVLNDFSDKIIEYLPEAINLGMDLLMALVEGLVSQLPTLMETAVQIIVTITNSLSQHLPELIPVAVEAIITLVETLIDNIDLLVDASIQLMTSLARGLIDALPILIDKAPTLVESLCNALIDNSPKMGEASTELVGQLVQGLIQNAWQLNKACWKIVETILDSFINLYKQDYLSIGRRIVEGIWEGMSDKTKWLINKIVGWFNNVVAAVKNFLGIASPSKLFANEVGAMMAEGVAVGWNNELGNVRRDINGSLGTLLPDSTANIGVVSSMRGTGIRGAMADSVNALGSLLGGNGSGAGDLNLVFNVNGREFYRATLADFRLVQAQNPIILNDF